MTAVQPQPETRLSHSVSSIRRKPLRTYLSPSSSEVRGPLHLIAASSTATPSSSISTTPSFSSSKSTTSSSPATPATSFPTLSRTSMGPPLPLYHPFGKLAMSLPPLDPAILGITMPININDDSSRSSGHSKRSGVKLRDAAVETDPIPPVASVIAVAAIAAREVKDKASPRKKRAGGRKRNRNDDADDATYPAKRTRQPRGAPNGAPTEDDPDSPEGPSNSVQSVEGPGTSAELSDKPERRTTRSRGAISRRDSTASETPSISAASAKVNKDVVLELGPRDVTGDKVEKRRSTSKEEGEVSEESKSA